MEALQTQARWNPESTAYAPSSQAGTDPQRASEAAPHRTGRSEPTNGVDLPEDRVSLSGRATLSPPEQVAAQRVDASQAGIQHPATRPGTGVDQDGDAKPASDETGLDGEALETQEAAEVRELKQRDAEVKAHEQAHMAAGGGLVQGAASYTYAKGPDGAMYAVGGEVKIDTSPARTPDQTIRKAQMIRRAALAPAQPSGTDRAVAAAASQMEAQARAEKTRETAEGDGSEPPQTAAGAEPHPSAEDQSSNNPTSPFTAPALQAYQAAATSGPTNRPFSTFA